MLFLLAFISVLIFSSAFVIHFLLSPASQVWGFLLPLHLVFYFLALGALLFVIIGRLRGQPRSENGLRFLIGAYLFSFLGIHSLFFTALLLIWPIHFLFSVSKEFAALYSLGAAYLFALIGLVVARLGPQLLKVSVGQGAPFKILQISDLHIGATLGRGYVKRVVDQTLASEPDCIVLTGDIGDGSPALHAASVAELGRLRAPHGVFLVLGNHELYWPTSEWVEAFSGIGMQVLRDEGRELRWQGKSVWMVGLSPEKRTAISSLVESPEHLIVLAHYPNRAAEAASAQANLFLAGHTHGGQFWPWSWVIHFFHEHAVGLYCLESTHVYVSRGAGYWGPPLRFGRRAEITLVELGLG